MGKSTTPPPMVTQAASFLDAAYEALDYPADWQANFMQRWRKLSPRAKQQVYDCWNSGGRTIDRARMAASMVA